ncbi:MAG: class I SAM-dependent methyltransferase [Eubacterium sp.]|nr:class I SAM-dependent methyltransferase [Eubacterium sp.]
MNKFEGVSNTLFVPLVARIAVSKKFPEYFCDKKALELEGLLPSGVDKGASDYSNLASVARYYNTDRMIKKFAKLNGTCNVVCLGAGLETAYDRIHEDYLTINWFEVDLPEVIKARREVLGERDKEILISGDMFKMEWVKEIDTAFQTLLVVSGVFQYFHEEEVVDFIRKCQKAIPYGEIIFDATNSDGLKFTNWFIKRTGNKNAIMYFAVDDGDKFANKCNATLIEEKTFFTEARAKLNKKVGFITRISMKVADEKRRVMIYKLKL